MITSTLAGGTMVLKVDIESVGEGQGLALGHVRGDLLVVDVGAQLVRHQHHHDVAGLGGLLHFHHAEIGTGGGELLRLGPVGGALPQAHHHVDTALGQVLRMGMALRAEADHGHGLAVQQAQVAVSVVILFDCHVRVLLFCFLTMWVGMVLPMGPEQNGRSERKKPLPLASKRQRLLKHLRGTTLVNGGRSFRRHLSRPQQALHGNGCARHCLSESSLSAGYSRMISPDPTLVALHQPAIL